MVVLCGPCDLRAYLEGGIRELPGGMPGVDTWHVERLTNDFSDVESWTYTTRHT